MNYDVCVNVFVSESVCGGGWPESVLPSSLAAEGGAMLHALCDDLTKLPGVTVTTTLDPRCLLRLPQPVDVVRIESPAAEEAQFLKLAADADVTLVIAPELDNRLARRVRSARSAGAHVIAPPADIIELCSDKLRLASFLNEHQVQTIPTESLAVETVPDIASEQLVVKPRFGAGSQDLTVIPSHDVLQYRQPTVTAPRSQRIVQPLVPGQTLSIGGIFKPAGQGDAPYCDLFPIAQQFLSVDGRSRYLGGEMPWEGSAATQIRQIVRECHRLLPGLDGYIGFDFIVTNGVSPGVALVEINPRLCTSYLGYRRLTDENLAARMLPDGPQTPIVWRDRLVRYQPDGACTVTPVSEQP